MAGSCFALTADGLVWIKLLSLSHTLTLLEGAKKNLLFSVWVVSPDVHVVHKSEWLDLVITTCVCDDCLDKNPPNKSGKFSVLASV